MSTPQPRSREARQLAEPLRTYGEIKASRF